MSDRGISDGHRSRCLRSGWNPRCRKKAKKAGSLKLPEELLLVGENLLYSRDQGGKGKNGQALGPTKSKG